MGAFLRQIDRETAVVAGIGALIGLLWLVSLPLGLTLAGAAAPIGSIVLVLRRRWMEIGILLASMGLVPLLAYRVFGPPTVSGPLREDLMPIELLAPGAPISSWSPGLSLPRSRACSSSGTVAVASGARPITPRGGVGGWTAVRLDPRLDRADAARMVFPWQKRNVPPELSARVPPGQVLTDKFPVLSFGRVPSYGDLSGWDFRVWGDVEEPFTLRWAEFRQLPVSERTLDIHCVTRWSKLDTRWHGVAFSHIADVARPTDAAAHVIFHAEGGYTANVPLATAMQPDCILAWSYAGEPLTPEHGYPLRAIVPGTYFWKSAKWLRGVEFSAEDRPGFWERNGYNNNADPWKEERYSRP